MEHAQKVTAAPHGEEPMIRVQNLYHAYKKDGAYAVNNVSFAVQKGEVLGFLGPSGAGKSTTQNILTGLLPLGQGAVEVAGFDMAKPHRALYNKMGVCFEQANVYSKLTALENLRFYAKMFDVPTRDPAALLELVGLRDTGKKKAGAFSKGMKQRLNFARSMLNNPALWFLDEPTSGLDPAIADRIQGIIRQRNAEGVTVFLTTHNMAVADALCDRVAFIVDGEIKLIDSPKALKLRFGKHLVDVSYRDGEAVREARFSTEIEADRLALCEVIAQYPIRTMHTEEATLEQIFIKVTGASLAGEGDADGEDVRGGQESAAKGGWAGKKAGAAPKGGPGNGEGAGGA